MKKRHKTKEKGGLKHHIAAFKKSKRHSTKKTHKGGKKK